MPVEKSMDNSPLLDHILFSVGAVVLNVVSQALLSVWRPDPSDPGMFFAVSFIFGAATSTLEFYTISELLHVDMWIGVY